MEPTYISVQEEIDAIKARLTEMGAVYERVKGDFSNVVDLDDRRKPMAKHKIKAAKLRKKKRKRGGPR